MDIDHKSLFLNSIVNIHLYFNYLLSIGYKSDINNNRPLRDIIQVGIEGFLLLVTGIWVTERSRLLFTPVNLVIPS